MKQYKDKEHRKNWGSEDRTDQGNEEEEGEAESIRTIEHGGQLCSA